MKTLQGGQVLQKSRQKVRKESEKQETDEADVSLHLELDEGKKTTCSVRSLAKVFRFQTQLLLCRP